jgi:hypothetical protein
MSSMADTTEKSEIDEIAGLLSKLTSEHKCLLDIDEESQKIIDNRVKGYMEGCSIRLHYRAMLTPPPAPALHIKLHPKRDRKPARAPHLLIIDVLKLCNDYPPSQLIYNPKKSALEFFFYDYDDDFRVRSDKCYDLMVDSSLVIAKLAKCKIVIEKVGLTSYYEYEIDGFHDYYDIRYISYIITNDLKIPLDDLFDTPVLSPSSNGFQKITIKYNNPQLCFSELRRKNIFEWNFSVYNLKWKCNMKHEILCLLCEDSNHHVSICPFIDLLPKWKTMKEKDSEAFSKFLDKLDTGNSELAKIMKVGRTRKWIGPDTQPSPLPTSSPSSSNSTTPVNSPPSSPKVPSAPYNNTRLEKEAEEHPRSSTPPSTDPPPDIPPQLPSSQSSSSSSSISPTTDPPLKGHSLRYQTNQSKPSTIKSIPKRGARNISTQRGGGK